MTYRPTEFEVENHTGISLQIRLNAECPEDEGGNVWFEVTQDSSSIVVNLGALEMLVDAANELLAGWREKKAPRTMPEAASYAQLVGGVSKPPALSREAVWKLWQESCAATLTDTDLEGLVRFAQRVRQSLKAEAEGKKNG